MAPQLNPDIEVYLNETIDFFVDTPNQPFWIKQKNELGPGEVSPIWANRMDNNGTTAGRLRVRFNQPGTYYYVSQADERLRGRLIVLPISKRLPDPPNQIFIVKTGLPIAKASDAVVLIPGDTSNLDIKGGTTWTFSAPNNMQPGFEDVLPPLGYSQQDVKKMGSGSLHFDTPGHPDPFVRNDWYGRDTNTIPDLPTALYWDIGVLRAWGGVNSNHSNATAELFPFDDSWTLEFWINFKTFNEDDPTFDPDHPANSRVTDLGAPIPSYYRRPPYVRLVETEEDFYVGTYTDVCCDENGDTYPGLTGLHYATNLQIDFIPNLEPQTDLAYFRVKIWNDDREKDTPPQFEHEFELPRVVNSQTGERVQETINRNQWHHIAFTKDSEREAFTLYIDGVRRGQAFDSSLAQPMDALGDDYFVALGGWARADKTNFEFDGNQIQVLDEGPLDEEEHASLNGYMDDIRITRGIVYRGPNYVVPTKPFRTDNTLLYEYDVTSETGNYIVDGEGKDEDRDPTIQARVGDDLVFNVNAPGHPFWIKDTNSTGTGNATETWATLSGNGSEDGTVTATFLEEGTYYYNCEYHAAMVGEIKILPALI